MFRAVAIASVLVLAAPALGSNLPSLRAELSQVDGRLKAAQAQRAELQGELDPVTGRIEAMKAAGRGKGRLFADPELDRLLKRSQELSSALTELLRAERGQRDALGTVLERLATGLDAEIASMRARWDASARVERQALVPQIKSLRAERDALRQALPSVLVPRLSDLANDDPEEMRERADALYDSEDKLRGEEKALAARIEELKGERDLERRMSEFLSEGALFDEHDRRISASPRSASSGSADSSKAPASSSPSVGAGGDRPTGGTVPAPTVFAPPAVSAAGVNAPGVTGNPEVGSGTIGSRSGVSAEPMPSGAPAVGRQDAPTPVGPSAEPPRATLKSPPERRGERAPYSDDESLEELASRRGKIRALADEARRRADEMARRARELR
jgi:hypothetical protein